MVAWYFEHDNNVASAQEEISALEKAESELMQIERDMRSAEEVFFPKVLLVHFVVQNFAILLYSTKYFSNYYIFYFTGEGSL